MWLPYFSQYVKRELVQFLGARPWNYKNDLCMTGAALLAEATGEETWNRVISDSGKWLLKEDGSVAGWKEGEHNIDKVSFGKSLGLLRDLTGEERYEEGVRKAYAFLDHYPRTVTGNFWHKDIYPNQVWLDGLYMAMPFYARCLTENGEDRWDDIVDQFQSAHDLLWDEKKKLYIHGCDVSRQADWADPETGRSPAVWLRAEGWYVFAGGGLSGYRGKLPGDLRQCHGGLCSDERGQTWDGGGCLRAKGQPGSGRDPGHLSEGRGGRMAPVRNLRQRRPGGRSGSA